MTIPDAIDGLPVTELGLRAFVFNTSITSVWIPDTVLRMNYSVFFGCTALTSVRFGMSLTNIGDYAFHGCTNLTQIAIPDSVISIDFAAFAACRSLTNLSLGVGLRNIGESAFAGCENLTNLVIPEGVRTIGRWAFTECGKLSTVTIADGLTNVGGFAFTGNSLTNVVLPDSVLSVAGSAFGYSPYLTSITFGSGLTYLEGFPSCPNLKGVYFRGNAPFLLGNLTDGDNSAVVYYLTGALGWPQVFGNLPTELWRPQVDTQDAGFGVQTNGFAFKIAYADQMTVVVEASSDLTNSIWLPLGTNVLKNGSVYFSDPDWRSHRSRFYRVRSL